MTITEYKEYLKERLDIVKDKDFVKGLMLQMESVHSCKECGNEPPSDTWLSDQQIEICVTCQTRLNRQDRLNELIDE